ncbi:MAG: molybdenum cofactor biosynthesis protein MoaE [Balneolaceae bacterium]|nr:molybdenum cofactor biosynthesis protein MoaE [Balneolaceae bacterium]
MNKIIELTENIDCSQVHRELSHPSSGGICIFIGTVREMTGEQEVEKLYYEVYEEMALAEMEKIADEAIARWNLNKVIIKHALGAKQIEEPVVVVGASAAHRKESFEACRFLIDTLKERVPIWKKEYFKNNKEVWVSGRPKRGTADAD